MYRLWVLLLGVTICALVSGKYTFGRCTRYRIDEIKNGIFNGDRYCVKNGRFDYCYEWQCPPTKCTAPIITGFGGGCNYCPGTCSYGGIMYKVGDSVDCLDGVNHCMCRDNNSIQQTKLGSAYPHIHLCVQHHNND